MLINQSKTELIFEIHGLRNENTCRNVLKLLDILISETRLDNDLADTSSVLKNQGKIAGYRTLKEYIEDGLPSVNKFA